jgi:hypothetical protein
MKPRRNRAGNIVWMSWKGEPKDAKPPYYIYGAGWDLCKCPYGEKGDRLWGKETWGVGTRPDPFVGYRDGLEYKADSCGEILPLHEVDQDLSEYFGKNGWKSSGCMPRWASRILLEIVSVRVERLQDISRDDAIAQGVWTASDGNVDATNRNHVGAFFSEWNDVHGPAASLENPWVWVVEFKRVEA